MSRWAWLCLLGAGPAAADSAVWLIGGGSEPDNTQVQIEQNLRWLEGLLLDRNLAVRTYFALGDEPGKDIAYFDPEVSAASTEGIGTLARIFGEPLEAGLGYRRHELRSLAGSTLKESLISDLTLDFSRHDAGSDVLVVFNGHGGLDTSNVQNNYLKLWGDEDLDVGEVRDILDVIPPDVTTRFVMTQCYSGAFQSLVDLQSRKPAQGAGKTCGFMSESALEMAEGCGLIVNEAGLRDYTTFFFAGLSGETRLGEPADVAAFDFDDNRRASFREAHFYALANAHSADLPRSTSEAYLTEWTPWYLDWDASVDGQTSVYWGLAEQVGLRTAYGTSPAELEAHRSVLLADQARLRERRSESEDRIEARRAELRAELLTRWPELAHPYSPAYHAVIDSRWPVIEQRIRSDSTFAELVAAQDELQAINGERRELARHMTQIDKIYRLKRLARLEVAMQTYGSARARREYRALVDCEEGHLED
jgi:hypothetical protein